VAVISRDDSPVGRRRTLTPTATATAAADLGLPIIRTDRLNDDVSTRIAALDPDLGVIVAYGALVREPLLSTPRLGWINLHFSLLPRWRGAAPVQRALIAGDSSTGATVFRLVAELDAGDILGQVVHPIGGNETAGHLLGSLAESGAVLLRETIDRLALGTAVGTPQAGEPSYAPKLGQSDGRIDWEDSAPEVVNRIRGVTPEPGAFTVVGGDRLKIHEAWIGRDLPATAPGMISAAGDRITIGTSTDPVELLIVQPAGGRAMPAADWWRGRPGDAAAEIR
jgi:methionyl-tRNA formyltransferase